MFDIPEPKNHNQAPPSLNGGVDGAKAKLALLLQSQKKIKENKCKPINFSQRNNFYHKFTLFGHKFVIVQSKYE